MAKTKTTKPVTLNPRQGIKATDKTAESDQPVVDTQENVGKNVILPETRKDASRLTELKGLSRSDLVERYRYEFAKEPDPAFTDQELIEAVESSAPNAPAKKLVAESAKQEVKDAFYGKGDKDKKYSLKPDWKKSVVVRQVVVQELHGGMVEVPNTEQIQTYAPEAFQKMVDDKFFSQSKMKIEILHDPR